MQESNHKTLYLVTRLYKEFFKPYISKLCLALVAMIIAAVCNAGQAWLIKPALDEIFFLKNENMLLIVPIAIVITFVIKGAASYCQNYLLKFVGQRFVTDMQSLLYSHLIYADFSYLQQSNNGKIISRLTSDILMLRTSIMSFLSGVAKELFTVIFLIMVMFYLDPILSFIMIFTFPLTFVPLIKLGKRMRKISNDTQEELGDYVTSLDESFQAIRVVKCFELEATQISKTKTILETIFGFYSKALRIESLSSPIVESLSGVAIALVIWYGGYEVMSGDTSPGSFFAFITSFFMAYKPLKNLMDLNNNIQESLATVNRIFKVLDTKPTIFDQKDSKELLLKNGHIKFNNVSFFYDQKKPVLNNLNLTIPEGKTIALVGNSGGGKSTLVNLLMRLYDPVSGEILIDDQDIKQTTLSSLRKNISIVTQEIILFNDTIYNNIACGKPGATHEEIVQAAKHAYADNFIDKLPENYQTIIGQNGFKLSGGQKQRIAIARALLKNSSIMIFDEATSSLDSIAERNIQQSIKKLRKNLTTIIIAHRLSTIIDADIIYVVKNGQIVEQGNHKELIENKGEYLALYQTLTSEEK